MAEERSAAEALSTPHNARGALRAHLLPAEATGVPSPASKTQDLDLRRTEGHLDLRTLMVAEEHLSSLLVPTSRVALKPDFPRILCSRALAHSRSSINNC